MGNEVLLNAVYLLFYLFYSLKSAISWRDVTDYIAVGHACAQSIWLKHQLMDYDVKLEKVTLYCDNTSAINLTKNPI